MSADSVLRLQHYVVKNISFKINDSFKPSGKEIKIHPEFQRSIGKIDENTAAIDLMFRVKSSSAVPFSISICIEGVFELNGWDCDELRNLMVTNTTAILFPYLRSLVAMITANANIAPYTLPVMNINELFAGVEARK